MAMENREFTVRIATSMQLVIHQLIYLRTVCICLNQLDYTV